MSDLTRPGTVVKLPDPWTGKTRKFVVISGVVNGDTTTITYMKKSVAKNAFRQKLIRDDGPRD